ncbi:MULTISPECIES: lantibiotic immunity ABC transporter MutE/EpiE family permease subunit [unclassified Lysinibacillus]|uniref:lantibiotic immunity ABC transporter MutE/EpiE family permease subunit n=1 Tax=unclassified Lysinibacillus TaxID=2636778 RepID=UPI00381B6F5F
MISIMKAERLKWKKTFIPKLVWLAPIVAIVLTALLMGGKFFQSGAYNFWYTLLLPGALTICCTLVVEKDAKLKYHSILAMPIDLKKIWFGKILTCSAWLLVTTLIFFVSISASGVLFGTSYSLTSSFTGSSVIFLTLLWQIPFCLFLAAKLGTYIAILINLVGNMAGMIAFANGDFWYSVPYAITARLICPTLEILPNGLLVPEGSPLLNTWVIAPGILIALVWFALISFLTARWFQKREAK